MPLKSEMTGFGARETHIYKEGITRTESCDGDLRRKYEENLKILLSLLFPLLNGVKISMTVREIDS